MGALSLDGVAVGALVACSGGRDSVALLHAVTTAGLRPNAVTIDHGLGPHGTRAAAHVSALCAAWQVPHRTIIVQVGPGDGPEDAARRARYAGLFEEADRVGAPSILLAHTADDQIETVLMRLVTGCGARGLAGMPAQRDRLHRPWLATSRDRVARYAIDNGLSWIDDPTNAALDFRRNRVRHLLVPALTETFGAGWQAGVLASARLTRIEADKIARQAPLLDALLHRDSAGISIELTALDALSAADQRRVFRGMVADLPARRWRSAMDTLATLVASNGSAKAVDLPGPWRAVRRLDRLRVERFEASGDVETG